MTTDTVNYLIGNPPRGITKKGNLVILLFLAALFSVACIVRYPDVLLAEATITGVNPPVSMLAKADGMITLFVNDRGQVEKNRLLAYIANPACYKEVNMLGLLLDSLNPVILNPEIAGLEELALPESGRLGPLQEDYMRFGNALHETQVFVRLKSYSQQIRNRTNELTCYGELLKTKEEQRLIIQNEYRLVLERHNVDQELYDQDLISKADLDASKSKLYQYENRLKQSESEAADCRIAISGLRSGLTELETEYCKEAEQRLFRLREAYDNLVSALHSWEDQYLVRAPAKGTVVFTGLWSNMQNIKKGENILTVVPCEGRSYTGRLRLPLQSAGKAEEGQKVRVELDNYPANEFGWVEGIVVRIPEVPDNGYYSVSVAFPDTLRTSSLFTVPDLPELSGTARIITRDRSLQQRLFEGLAAIK
ncbi:MAG: HlyD family efflux transporter periplasmic adaptor subunit [Bacteroidetes bacterium]|nr:HlyD family efflux transporter periplasmic adaptor subunit [Bacteroidota bacterium]